MKTVRGWVEWPGEARWQSSAVLYIRVEDVSRADGLALRLGEQVIKNIEQSDLARGRIEFRVPVAEPSRGAVCAVRVHLDLDGDGVVSRGDYVSTERVPVLGADPSPPALVRLRRVG